MPQDIRIDDRQRDAPRFSVVIPTHDRARFLPHAVASVLAQRFDGPVELIVVDDGSTDETRQCLDRFSGRLRYVYQPNAGAASAKNRGLREARGEWIGFLDSDDAWEPGTLAAVAEVFASRPDVGLVSIMARETGPDGRPTSRVYGKRTAGPLYTTRGLLWGDSGGCSWFFVRREIVERTGGFDESLRSAEECDLFLRVSFETSMYAIRRPLLLRRKHDGNLSLDTQLNARSWIALLEKFGRERREFVQRHPWVFRRALAKERLRLGRELLAGEPANQDTISESRRQLLGSVATFPFFLRAYGYLGWSWLAPRAYASWRRREVKYRERLRSGRRIDRADDRSPDA